MRIGKKNESMLKKIIWKEFLGENLFENFHWPCRSLIVLLLMVVHIIIWLVKKLANTNLYIFPSFPLVSYSTSVALRLLGLGAPFLVCWKNP